MFLGKKYVLAALILAVAVSAAHAQTFGKSKKKIVLHRKLPAIAPLTGKTFTVRVTVRDPKHKDLAGKLTDMVEAEIIRNDRRLSAEKAGGENVISCSNETNLREKAHADLVRRGLLPVSPDDVNIHD